jgi:hypothetical protein
MGWLAKTICSALVSASVAENDDMALLQAHRFGASERTPVTLPGDTCVVAGDPHIETFDMDGIKETCLGPMGDYVLMDNGMFFVHGRYRGYQRSSGYAFVQGLVIGGSEMGGNINIPTHNNGCITYKGTCLAKQYGKNDFDLGNGVSLTIRKASGPDLVNFKGADSMSDQSRILTYWIEVKKAGVLDFLVMVNQGAMQHVVISGTTEALKGTTGQCGNDNGDVTDDHFNVDKCPGKLPCDKGLFGVENPECDKPREPDTCKSDSKKVAFFKDICEKHFGSEAYATTHYMKPGDSVKEWQVWNCITDCCADRDTCPDQTNWGEWADCLIQGDPHVKTFDSPVVNKNAYGPLDDYTLVKNEYINVQGRYGSVRSDNKASLMGVAVSGQLVGGATIVIPKGYEHAPTIDGKPIKKKCKKNKNCNLAVTPEFTIRYEPKGVNLHFIFDKTNGNGKPRPLFVVVLTNPVDGTKWGRVRVNRARNAKSVAMAAHITMQSAFLTNVQGQCGNFNGDPKDDTSKEDDIVSAAENLFPDTNPQQGSVPFNKPCTKGQKKKAMRCCKERHGKTTLEFLNGCVTDNCCGADKPCNPRHQCMAGVN